LLIVGDPNRGRSFVTEINLISAYLFRGQGMIALVLTDILDSTYLEKRMGTTAWKKLLKKHFERARFYKRRYGGAEVKRIGDSIMIAFPTADKALLFALEFNADTGDPLIRIRIGINVGTVQLSGEEICGLMINYLSRMLSVREQSGIIFTQAAKRNIESQLGAKIEDLGRIEPFAHPPLRGFEDDEQVLYEIIPAGCHASLWSGRVAS
jgi:class 3 adenylate cyclase